MPSLLDTNELTDKQKSRTFKFAKPQFPYDAIHKPWCVAMRKKRLFIYYKEEMMPRFVFDRRHSEWKGHGIRVKSIRDIMEWIDKQPLKNMQI